MKGLAILGSTGTIGVNTLEVVAQHPDRFRVVALTANRDAERLFEQCKEHRPDFAVLVEDEAAKRLERMLADAGIGTEVLQGSEALSSVVTLDHCDYVMAGIVGAAGLMPTLAAARAGKRVLLANKESLVMAGGLFMDAVREGGCTLLPIDSEHNALFQCMPAGFLPGMRPAGVTRLLLTASGGPFRERPVETLEDVSPDEACAHPNWVMGRKISVDSATMMNKGLELIEACLLFRMEPEHIQVVIHPQSIVHSMVEYADGSVLAQMGQPDMRTPIAHGLAWPDRVASGVAPLDLFAAGRLDFEPPSAERFPCLTLAAEALRGGGDAPAVLNAANEVAVAAFLDGRIGFMDIPRVIERSLCALPVGDAASLDAVLAADAAARRRAASEVQRVGRG
jgi:1-deoxy-D-xylulose-5-phosphate reductoisomerase